MCLQVNILVQGYTSTNGPPAFTNVNTTVNPALANIAFVTLGVSIFNTATPLAFIKLTKKITKRVLHKLSRF